MAELVTTSLYNDANLVSYWRFEGNSNDSKGSNNGTDTNITYVNGKYGQCANYNTLATSYISLGTGSSLNLNGALTIVGWIYPDSTNSATKCIFARGIPELATQGWFELRIPTANSQTLQYNVQTSSNPIYEQDWKTNNNVLTYGAWNHIAITRASASGTPIFYVNGISVASSSIYNGGGSGAGDQPNFATATAFIGAENTGAGDFKMCGNIDDFAIFTKALSSTEINTLYTDNVHLFGLMGVGN